MGRRQPILVAIAIFVLALLEIPHAMKEVGYIGHCGAADVLLLRAGGSGDGSCLGGRCTSAVSAFVGFFLSFEAGFVDGVAWGDNG